jgi:hypothetical protein
VCQLTKEQDTTRRVLHRPERFVSGFTGPSGNMDEAGAIENARALMEGEYGPFYRNAIFVEDGDSKGTKPSEFLPSTGNWTNAKCKCHKAKNARGACKGSKMSCLPCRCVADEGREKACTSQPGFRMKDTTAFKLSAQYYRIIFAAVLMYLPELEDPINVLLPADVGSPAREVSRQAAIKWANEELTIMVKHLCGDHDHCKHGDLPEVYPAVRCVAQQKRVAEVVLGLQGCLPDVLSPMGLLDINAVESQHAVLRKHREKGVRWGAAQCFLAECLGFLEWQQLMMAFWGYFREPRSELAKMVLEHLGVDIELTEVEIAGFAKDLKGRLTGKELRSSEHAQKVRAVWRKRSLLSQADQRAAATYKGGGSAAAVDADLEAAVGVDLEVAVALIEETTKDQEHTAAEMIDPGGYGDEGGSDDDGTGA